VQIRESEIDFNKMLEINDYSMAIDDFYDPFISCCFISDNLVFVNLFHTFERAHYHFIWDVQRREIHGKITKVILDCSIKNFP
jgi:hypothetical protein